MSTAVAKQSMFGAITGAVPAEGALAKPIETQPDTPYAGFYSKKSNKAGEIRDAIPGIAEGAPYVCTPNGFKGVRALKFVLLDAAQFWVQRDSNNQPTKVTTDNPGDFKSPLKETIETLCLTFLDDNTVLPTLVTFGTARAKAAHTAIKALDQAKSPQWGEKSADHRETLRIPDPRFRFTTTVTTGTATIRSGDRKGELYGTALGSAKPISLADAKVIESACANKDFTAALAQATRAFKGRVAQLSEMAGRG